MFIEHISDAISCGSFYLQQEQRRDGSFFSYSSPAKSDFSSAIPFHSVFSNALILSCLSSFPDSSFTQNTKKLLADFLLSEKSDYWTWNYWSRKSKEFKKLPYPDDLDDTFCALSALHNYNKKLIPGDALAYAVHALTSCEVQEGGPYRTWLVPPSAEKVWRDVDIVVNSNIAYFLALQEITLPGVTKLLEDAIENKVFTSPYYPTIYPFIYFLSRFYKGDYTKKLQKFLLVQRHKDGSWGNTLDTSLATIALLNFGTRPHILKKSISSILSHQHLDGSWKPAVFYTGVNPDRGKIFYAGSCALTTAFCLQALSMYHHLFSKPTEQSENAYMAVEKNYTSIEKEVLRYPPEISTQGVQILQKIQEIEKYTPIALLPYIFTQSLKQPVDKKLLQQTSVATIYGWMAYTIYDDFLDQEGDPKKLSIANLCLRKLVHIYEHILPEESKFVSFFHTIMNNLDSANTWEVTGCRFSISKKINLDEIALPDFGNYQILADKSFGHALGPLAILFSFGLKESSQEIQNVEKFFMHFLTAKQLNDDAHDVFKDLEKGHITAVGTILLKDYQKVYKTPHVSLKAGRLKKVFWEETINKVCEDIIVHCRQGKDCLTDISVMQDTSIFLSMINKLQSAAEKAIEERNSTQAFLKAYHSI